MDTQDKHAHRYQRGFLIEKKRLGVTFLHDVFWFMCFFLFFLQKLVHRYILPLSYFPAPFFFFFLDMGIFGE